MVKLEWDAKTGLNWYLTSWKSNDDPSTGEYSFKLNINGFPEVFLRRNKVIQYRSGPWSGLRFSGVPEMKPRGSVLTFSFVMNRDNVFYSFGLTNNSVYSRLLMMSTGVLQRYTWIETGQLWNPFWYAPKDQCDRYGECGVYGICDTNDSPVCKCMEGFEPRNLQAWELRDGHDGMVANPSDSPDELQRITKISESGGVVDVNGGYPGLDRQFSESGGVADPNGGSSGMHTSEIQNEGTVEVDLTKSAPVTSELLQLQSIEGLPSNIDCVTAELNKSVPKLKISIIVVGTREDVQPFLAVAWRFQEFGHHVRLVTHVNLLLLHTLVCTVGQYLICQQPICGVLMLCQSQVIGAPKSMWLVIVSQTLVQNINLLKSLLNGFKKDLNLFILGLGACYQSEEFGGATS